jgi:hypothetical protein
MEMSRRVQERERNWECRDRAGEVQELTRSQWQEAMGLGGGLQSWENLDEETEALNQAAAWWGREGQADVEEEQGPEWEADWVEKEVKWIAGQFPQADTELVEGWAGSGDREGQGIEQKKKSTTPDGKDGRVRPPLEADRLLQEEEEKEKKLKDWRAVKEIVLEQEEEDSVEPSPRVKESWMSK